MSTFNSIKTCYIYIMMSQQMDRHTCGPLLRKSRTTTWTGTTPSVRHQAEDHHRGGPPLVRVHHLVEDQILTRSRTTARTRTTSVSRAHLLTRPTTRMPTSPGQHHLLTRSTSGGQVTITRLRDLTTRPGLTTRTRTITRSGPPPGQGPPPDKGHHQVEAHLSGKVQHRQGPPPGRSPPPDKVHLLTRTQDKDHHTRTTTRSRSTTRQGAITQVEVQRDKQPLPGQGVPPGRGLPPLANNNGPMPGHS
jgi:hypothetical protein